MSSKYQQIMLDVLDHLIECDGVVEGEPGTVLKDLAERTGHPYKWISLAVLGLESAELVQVDRLSHPSPERANRICSIHLI